MTSFAKALTGLCLIALVACARVVPTGDAMVAQCQAEVAPFGTYEYDQDAAVPVMRAVDDGTPDGAQALNACIRTKATDAGLVAMSTSTGFTGNICPDGAPALYGGATYCIGPK